MRSGEGFERGKGWGLVFSWGRGGGGFYEWTFSLTGVEIETDYIVVLLRNLYGVSFAFVEDLGTLLQCCMKGASHCKWWPMSQPVVFSVPPGVIELQMDKLDMNNMLNLIAYFDARLLALVSYEQSILFTREGSEILRARYCSHLRSKPRCNSVPALQPYSISPLSRPDRRGRWRQRAATALPLRLCFGASYTIPGEQAI